MPRPVHCPDPGSPVELKEGIVRTDLAKISHGIRSRRARRIRKRSTLAGAWRARARSILLAGVTLLAAGVAVAAFPGTAAADATDDYPIPHRMIVTTCTAEQILAAARDFEPIYYQRYMIDYDNHSPDVQQATQDRIHWFYSLTPADRRAYSENIATNIFYEQMAFTWPNWAKVFFNNKGVAAHETDHCANYPPGDQSVWVS
jgi:hypothetical protein